MATAHGAVLRQPGSLSSAADLARGHARSARRAISRFARPGAFSLPSGLHAAAARAGRNATAFRVHYAVLLWFCLLASLFPSHRAAMIFLMAASKAALSYAVLLRVFPNSAFLHRVLDRRFVLAIFIAVVVVQLVLAGAVGNLLLSIGVAAPVVLAHAVLRISDDELVAEQGKAGGEMGMITEKKGGDLETGGGQRSDRSS